MPRRAPLPIAALIAVGVARPTAHGHATRSMVIARRTSRVTMSVSAETRNDAGTNRREKLSPDGLDGRPVALGLFDALDDPADGGLAADGVGPHHDPAPEDHRARRAPASRSRR